MNILINLINLSFNCFYNQLSRKRPSGESGKSSRLREMVGYENVNTGNSNNDDHNTGGPNSSKHVVRIIEVDFNVLIGPNSVVSMV